MSAKERLTALFQKYEPAKVGQVDKLLEKYAGKEEAFIKTMTKKYEAASPSSAASTPAATPRDSAPRSAEDRVRAIFAEYDKARVGQEAALLAKNPGKEEGVIKSLLKKYNATSEPGSTPSGSAPPTPREQSQPSAAAAGDRTWKDRLVAMYAKYEPSKVSTVDATLEKFKGKEPAVMKKLVEKYGPEPAADASASNSAQATPQPTPRESAPASTERSWKDRMVAMYAKYEPSKVDTVDATLEKFKGKEVAVMKKLVEKYGPEPTDSAPASPPATPRDAASSPTEGGAQGKPTAAERVRRIFEEYDTGRVGQETALLAKNAGKEEGVIKSLLKKYGASHEPSASVSATSSAAPTPRDPPNVPSIQTPQPRTYEERVSAIFAEYDKPRVGTEKSVLAKNPGKEEGVIRSLLKRYGATSEPTAASSSPVTEPTAAAPSTPPQESPKATPRNPKSKTYEERVRALFEEHDPGKVGTEAQQLAKHPGKEDAVIRLLMKRYGVTKEPGSDLPEEDGTEDAAPANTSFTRARSRSYYDRIKAMYCKYEPGKVDSVDGTIEKFKGKEEAVIKKLVQKYGPEPDGEVSAAAEAPAPAKQEEAEEPASAPQSPVPTPRKKGVSFADVKSDPAPNDDDDVVDDEDPIPDDDENKDSVEPSAAQADPEPSREPQQARQLEPPAPEPASVAPSAAGAEVVAKMDRLAKQRDALMQSSFVEKQLQLSAKLTRDQYFAKWREFSATRVAEREASELLSSGRWVKEEKVVSEEVEEKSGENGEMVKKTVERTVVSYRPAELSLQEQLGGVADPIDEDQANAILKVLHQAGYHRHFRALGQGTSEATVPDLAQSIKERNMAISSIGLPPKIVQAVGELPTATFFAAFACTEEQLTESLSATNRILKEVLPCQVQKLDDARRAREAAIVEKESMGKKMMEAQNKAKTLSEEMDAQKEELERSEHSVTTLKAEAAERIIEVQRVQETISILRKELADERRGIPSDLEMQLQAKDELAAHLQSELAKLRTAHRALKSRHDEQSQLLEEERRRLARSKRRQLHQPTHSPTQNSSPPSARAYRQPYAPSYIAPATAAASEPQHYAVPDDKQDLVQGSRAAHREEVIVMADSEGESGVVRQLRDDEVNSDFEPEERPAPARDNSTDESSDHLDADPEEMLRQESPAKGPCPNCGLNLTSFYGNRVGGSDQDKVAFCFSCRRAFSRKDLHLRDVRDAQRKNMESVPRFGAKTRASGWR